MRRHLCTCHARHVCHSCFVVSGEDSDRDSGLYLHTYESGERCVVKVKVSGMLEMKTKLFFFLCQGDGSIVCSCHRFVLEFTEMVLIV